MSEWPSGLRRQTQDIISFSVVEVSVLSMEAWDQIPLLTQAPFELEAFLRPSTLYTLLFILPSDQCKSLTSLHWNVRMAEWSKTPDSRRHLLLSFEVYGLHMEAWVQIPLLTEALFELEAFWDRKHYSLYCLFCHLTNANDRIVFNILVSTSQNGRAV